MVAPSRVRRAALSSSYRARAVDIDALNRRLHNKRPKFIGKRHIPITELPCRLDSAGNCGDGDGGGGLVVDKRRRKFMGKKSDDNRADDISALKFLSKRGQRKFLGRRAEPYPSDNQPAQLDRQLQSEIRSSLDKRGRRKFVG